MSTLSEQAPDAADYLLNQMHPTGVNDSIDGRFEISTAACR